MRGFKFISFSEVILVNSNKKKKTAAVRETCKSISFHYEPLKRIGPWYLLCLYDSSHRCCEGHEGHSGLSYRPTGRAAACAGHSEADPRRVSGCCYSSEPTREEMPGLDQSGNNNRCDLLLSVCNHSYCVSDNTVQILVPGSRCPLIGLYMRWKGFFCMTRL